MRKVARLASAGLCIATCVACSEERPTSSADSGGASGASGAGQAGGAGSAGASAGAGGATAGSGGNDGAATASGGSGGGSVNVSGKNVWISVEIPLTNEQDTPHVTGWSTAVFDTFKGELVVYERYVDESNADFIYSNALWGYDPVENRWRLRWKSPWQNTGYCAIANAGQTYDAPHDRHPYAQMVFDPSSNTIVQYGGPSFKCFGTDDLDNVWFFHSETGAWSHTFAPYGAIPLYEASFVLDQNRKRIISNNGLCNENSYRAFDLAKKSWSPFPIPSALYEARDFSAMAYADTTRQVLVFGGRVYGQPGNDTSFVLDTVSDSWKQISGNKPPGRYGHGLVYSAKHDIALLYGGFTLDDAPLHDTWVFDFKTQSWSELASAKAGPTPPMSTRIAPLAYDSIHDVFLMPAIDPASPYVYGRMWMLRYEP